MQKKSTLISIAFLIVLTFMMGVVALSVSSLWAYASSGDLYYSKSNKPVFFGTTKITMSKNVVSGNQLNIQDARFRTFARDFEDGDLTTKIQCTANNVNPSVAGSYSIQYSVTDSHNNNSTLTVPVQIEDNNNSLVTVERTIYTIPNDWNFQLMGVNRCNTGDRQHLGIYLPKGKSFNFKVLDGDVIKAKIKDQNEKCKIEPTNNNQLTESKHYIEWNKNEYTSITNNFNHNGETQLESVPLLTTPLLARGKDVNTTFKVEVSYNTNDVQPLQYYYYQDNEEEFTRAWEATDNQYAIVENEVVTMLLTRNDINAVKQYEFKTYDKILEYYVKVIERMDDTLGVSLNPEKAIHQNFRAKYLMRANAKGAGFAYYGGDHIGFSGPTMGYFFQMEWGTLHEIAHGYQGYLGKGEMSLGEVSNNIFCHYIQMDKSIYTENHDWLRKHEEDLRNQDRLSGKAFINVDLQTRLYALINLFDYFEGETTYKKMFRWYREKMLEGTFNTNTPNQDMYALFFAEVYDTNILPYWNQWKMVDVQESTIEATAKASKSISILKDSAGDKYTEIMQAENLNFNTDKYKPVADSVLQKYNVLSSVVIVMHIDTPNLLQNRKFLLEQGGVAKEQKDIFNGKVSFTDIPTGSYYLRAPALTGYKREIKFITLEQGQTYTIEVTYTPVDMAGFNSSVLGVRGLYNWGFLMELNNRTQGGWVY